MLKIAIKAAIVARKPASLSHVGAAALALAGLTAICTIEDMSKLEAGETILIQLGAGGVAALHLGARVFTTASASNHDLLREIGADEIVSSSTTRWISPRSRAAAARCSRRSAERWRNGHSACRSRAAFIASGPQARKPARSDVVALEPHLGRHRRHLEAIVELVTMGAVRPPQVRRYKLSEAAAAHEVSQSRHSRDKQVFRSVDNLASARPPISRNCSCLTGYKLRRLRYDAVSKGSTNRGWRRVETA